MSLSSPTTMHLLERRLSASSFTTCNTSLEEERISEIPLWNNGWTFHHLGLILCAAFGLFAILVSSFLMLCHATHYSKPREQRHILRILCMVPIYCLGAFLSFWLYRKAVYFETLGDCYEAFAISAFFSLLCHYLAPDLHSQKEYFRGIRPNQWIWPVNRWAKCCGGDRGCLRTPRSGLTWFNVIWVSVFQYCFIRITMTAVAVITEAAGRYCEETLSPLFSHVWILVIESVAVTIAMYALIQFFLQIRHDVAQYHAFMKILSIKLVIFLSFWQTTLISVLTSSGAIKSSAKMGTQDLKIGIPNLLICMEMACFSILHLYAFPWRPYTLANQEATGNAQYMNGKLIYQGGPLGIKALIDALNPWDLVKALARGFRWLFVGRKQRMNDPSYMDQTMASYSLKPSNDTGPTTTIPRPNVTAYGGPGAPVDDDRYGTPPDEEGQVLLSHAQQPSLSYPRQESSDIGTATFYDEDPSGHLRRNSYEEAVHSSLRPVSPQPYQPYNPHNSPYQAPLDRPDYIASHSRTGSGTTPVPPPIYHSDEGLSMPSPRHVPATYLPPPPDEYDHNNRL